MSTTLRSLTAAVIFLIAGWASATTLDDIGVTKLRSVNPTLLGTGVIVAQPEADQSVANNYQVNPAVGAGSIDYTYINGAGASATTFPNGVGTSSTHANDVAARFFGTTLGVAPDVSHVYSISANWYLNNVITPNVAFPAGPASPAKVVNQSFVGNNADQAVLDTRYDNYVNTHGTIIVSGLGNLAPQMVPTTPSTAYNVIAVAAFGGNSAVGPTYPGNSRSKPDIAAPASATSYSTPLVSGTAAVLVQAGELELGGVGTTADVTDPRTIKALLLNGATKPSGWTSTTMQPLDTRWGAGIVNAYNSYRSLVGGDKDAQLTTQTASVGGAHLPPVVVGNVGLAGWNLAEVTSSATFDTVDHYFFDITNPTSFVATLVWNRPSSVFVNPPINNLDLYLYDATLNTLVASSVSNVDNVEHIFQSLLAPGRYNLQVLKRGGVLDSADVTTFSQVYALAFLVPEPSGLILALLGTIACVGIRRTVRFRR